MGQRFSLDRPSFEQFLAAASFLQQIQKQAARNGVRDLQFAQPLLELVETQHAIETGNLGLETAVAPSGSLLQALVEDFPRQITHVNRASARCRSNPPRH